MIPLGALEPQAEEILILHTRIRVVAIQESLSPGTRSCFIVLNVRVLLLPTLVLWVRNIKGRTQIEGL